MANSGLQGKKGRLFLATLSLCLAIFLIAAAGGLLGYLSGKKSVSGVETAEARAYLEEQYQLGVADMEAGRYDLARQRFEYIILKDDTIQAAIDRYLEVIEVISATESLPPLPATKTPTPTIDPRPIEDLFDQPLALLAVGEWDQALETLAALRQADPTYRIIEVDGLIYIGLRNRGLDKIRSRGELEEGLYDFTLAEKFAPLDIEANNFRVWARYYLMGNGFWEAYPETAAYYYGLAASSAPYLKDSSGMTAFYRYWASLKQYADQFVAQEEWCQASQQYQLVMDAWAEEKAAVVATQVYSKCQASLHPTTTPTPLFSLTPTGTLTITVTPPSGTPTFTFTPAGTKTPTPTFTPTGSGPTNTPTNTPGGTTPTDTSPAPTPTSTSSAPTSTNTPTSTPTPTTTPGP
jgi:tetratricopeptide (TPR) repeat protein